MAAGESTTYSMYTGNDATFPIRFEAPDGWKATEESGTVDSYRAIRLLGPRNAEDTYTSAITIRQSPVKAQGGKFASGEELMEHALAHQLSGSTTEARTVTTVAETPAIDVTVAYTVPPLRLPKLTPLPIPVKTRTLVLVKGSYVYEVIYTADAREYSRHASVFERVARSLQIGL